MMHGQKSASIDCV